MKTFEDFLNEDFVDLTDIEENIILEDNLLNEKNFQSKHRRTTTQMALVHKGVLQKTGHTILNHETMGDGSHVIHHLTPKKNIRVTTIKPRKMGSNNTQIHNRPANAEEKEKYAPKN